jgi:hypothetical protein
MIKQLLCYTKKLNKAGARMLSIANYDAAEAAAIVLASYPAIRAFRPVAFSQVNFPTRVREEQELIRYADVMHELADRDLWYRRTPYSAIERTLMMGVSNDIEALTIRQFGTAIRPFMCLFPPIPLLRAINALAGDQRPSVLEIGPGSGTLGAYLIKSGFPYWATDNTQALYLWQNRLFGHLAGDAFADLVTDPVPSKTTLIPWWRFAEMFRGPPAMDIIVCDAALGEMDTFAVHYIARIAAEMLKGSKIGAILFSNIGEPRISTPFYIQQLFFKFGFSEQRIGSITAFSLKQLPPIEMVPIDGETFQTAETFLPISPTKLLPSYEFFDFIRLHQ